MDKTAWMWQIRWDASNWSKVVNLVLEINIETRQVGPVTDRDVIGPHKLLSSVAKAIEELPLRYLFAAFQLPKINMDSLKYIEVPRNYWSRE